MLPMLPNISDLRGGLSKKAMGPPVVKSVKELWQLVGTMRQ